jgi:hypothetical protein
MDIESGKRRFVSPFHVSTHGHRGMLGRILECLLDDIRGKPGKIGAEPLIVDCGGFDDAFVNLVHEITSRKDMVLEYRWGENMSVDDSKMAVVAESVKELIKRVRREVRDSVVPFIVIVNVIVKNGGAPLFVRSEDKMWKTIPFSIGIWAHGDIWEAALNIKGDKISVERLDALFTTNLARFVVNILFEPFHLTRGVDRFAFLSPGILVHNQDHFSELSVDNGASGDNGNVNDLVIVNTLDVDLSSGLMDDADVIASNATVGTSVDKGSPSDGAVVGRDVDGFGRVDFTKNFAIDSNVLGVGTTMLG